LKKERALWGKVRGDMLVKYFSEKLQNPEIHNKAMLKEGMDLWRKAYSKIYFIHNKAMLKEGMDLWRKAYSKIYFIHNKAMLKEGMDLWRKSYSKTKEKPQRNVDNSKYCIQ
jgi:hypothetical protein